MYKQKYHKYKQKYMDEKYSLSIKDPHLFNIQLGKKNVEGRKGNKNSYRDWIGKEVKFYNDKRTIPVKVTEVRHYDDLYKFVDGEGYDKLMPDKKDRQSVIDAYHEFYSDEAIKERGGMVGIVFELV